MEELDSSSHIVRIFQQDYHLSAEKQMIEKVVYQAANNGGHTRLHGDWNTSRKCHDLLHDWATLTKWRSVQVCTETLTFLAARMH